MQDSIHQLHETGLKLNPGASPEAIQTVQQELDCNYQSLWWPYIRIMMVWHDPADGFPCV